MAESLRKGLGDDDDADGSFECAAGILEEGGGIEDSSVVLLLEKRPGLWRFLDLAGFLRVLLMALRGALAVGLGIVIYDAPGIPQATFGSSWLIIFLSHTLAMPVLGMTLSVIPSFVLGALMVLLYAGIATAYPGNGMWNILTGVLIFFGALLGLWPESSSINTTMLFYIGPYTLVTYASVEGKQGIPDLISMLAKPMIVIVFLAIAIGLITCFVVPLTAFWVVKRLLIRNSHFLATLNRLIMTWLEQINPKARIETFANILVICSKVSSSLESAKKLMNFVQVEMPLGNIDGYKQRLQFLQSTLILLVEMVKCLKVTHEPFENPDVLEKHARFLDAFCEVKDTEQLRQDVRAVAFGGGKDDDLFVQCVAHTTDRIVAWKDLAYWTWSFNMELRKKQFKQIVVSWLPQNELYPDWKAYVKSRVFGARIANSVLGAGALTFSALFALIPSWRAHFFSSTWPSVVVGVLWTRSQGSSLAKATDRILATVVGGYIIYSIVYIAAIPIDDRQALNGLLVGVIFLLDVIYGKNASLRSTTTMVATLILFEPMDSRATLSQWLFDRIFLNLIGVLIVYVFQAIFFTLYPPLVQFNYELRFIFEDFEQALRVGTLLPTLDIRLGLLQTYAKDAGSIPLALMTVFDTESFGSLLDAIAELQRILKLADLLGYMDELATKRSLSLVVVARDAARANVHGEKYEYRKQSEDGVDRPSSGLGVAEKVEVCLENVVKKLLQALIKEDAKARLSNLRRDLTTDIDVDNS